MADSYKNISAPLSQGERAEPIKINTTGLRSIVDQGPGYVQMLVDDAPVSIDRMFGVKGGADADAVRAEFDASQRPTSSIDTVPHAPAAESMYAKGEVLFDMDRGCKVTIVKACVGKTKKGRNIHVVVSHKTGDSWRQSERKLRRL